MTPGMPRWTPITAAISVGAFIGIPTVALLMRAVAVDPFATASRPDALGAALWLSVTTSLVTLVIAIIVGTPAAFALARVPFPGRGLANALVDVPVILPPAVAGLALLLAFGRRGLAGSWLADAGITLAFSTTGVVLAQCFVSIPFYVRTVRAAFLRADRDLEAAAMIDGATGWGAFRHVTIPLARPALVAGGVLCWSRAMGEFGATLMFAGSLSGRTQTMPLAIYALLESDLDGAVLLGGTFVVVAVGILGITAFVTGRQPRAE